MLKRLELVGFKSFADKTVFNFGDGITAIVGPNGSGKSNVVDAVRWILGEQSAKSLRGGEMADVIFNGSSSRRGFGFAEVTMTLDNSRSLLASDAAELQVTRRVYRGGEGEYLLNGKVCRLRDIKELFLGSGAGHDAYCIIEQGKVDVLLQASTKERREIFEEAAGISRFKAKKIETLRKLEHVDQNLQRLKDIIEEVEKQLRSVKLQAAKAQRYQEYTSRLKELRVGLGLQEYHQLSEQLRQEAAVLEGLRAELEQRAAKATAWEADTQRIENVLSGLEDNLHAQEALLAKARQQIQAGETTLAHESALSADLEQELVRTRLSLSELTRRVTALAETVERSGDDLAAAQSQADSQRQGLRGLEESLQAIVDRLNELHQQTEADKVGHLEKMRQAAHLQNEAVASKAQVDNLRREHDRLRFRTEQAAENLASLDVELQKLTEADETLQNRIAASRQQLTDCRQERERLRQFRDETVERISALRQQRSGLASRVEVLEGLIRSHEGLGTGVREVFALIERADASPWDTVMGIVADFLTVRREHAPLIDLALGDGLQRFVVRDMERLSAALAARDQTFSGRVSFLPLTQSRVGTAHPSGAMMGGAHPTPPSHPGLVAVAEHLVACDHPELADLPRQLLGRTLIVRDLAAARAIAADAPGFRLVTLQGELLEPDGTLTVGTHHAETGLLSRKSELLELHQEVIHLDCRITEADQDLTALRDRIAGLDVQGQEEQERVQVLTEQAADLRSHLERHRDRWQGLHEEVSVSRDEIQRIEHEVESLEAAWHAALGQADEAEAQVQLLHDRMHQADLECRRLEQERTERQRECTAAEVALAKVEERLTALRAHFEQAENDLLQRRQEQQQSEQGLATGRARLAESQRIMLEASAALARDYLDKEAAEREVVELTCQRDQSRQERLRLAHQAQAVRNEWRIQQEQTHARELEINNLRHRRDSLADRLREDYQIELAELYQSVLRSQESGVRSQEFAEGNGVPLNGQAKAETCSPGVSADSWLLTPDSSSLTPERANEEIEELRRKLSRLGNVNLEALQELNELETRASTLKVQFDDLTAAKRSLEEIISKINQDSRRVFSEMFQTIRVHFQELFRKLFGGGMAEIVLEDEADILESGIEVIARPPGKELRSISLMSGGEKTLTAVALLLAIFRSKPSPFCILDEVDAALDEANIGRFTAVVREFLDRSQFIIVTHSKKTMAAADVLYGVTMQESGISKQVSVRFEDWPEDAPPAVEPAESSWSGS
jgi:chromosome segregation protein